MLRITSSAVTVMDIDMHEIVTHKRLYGEKHERMDWLPYLKYIARKPRSLRNSGIYDLVPENMRFYIDRCENSDRGRSLKVLTELTERSDFDSAVKTIDDAIRYNAIAPDSLRNLYRRTYADVPLLPPLDIPSEIPGAKVIPFRNDLESLDAVLKRGGAANV